MNFYKRIALLLLLTSVLSESLFAEEGMPQFNSETFASQLFWLFITFVILYLIINFFVLPRVRDNIRLRKNKISNDLERSEIIKLQVENIIKDYEEKINKSKIRAQETIKNTLDRADKDFSSQSDNVKKKIMQRITETEKETLEYKKNISKKTSNIVEEVSILLLKKIIGPSLSKDDMEYISKQVSIASKDL